MNNENEKIILKETKTVDLLYGLQYVIILLIVFGIVSGIFFYINSGDIYGINFEKNKVLTIFSIILLNILLIFGLILWFYLKLRYTMKKYNLSSYKEVRKFEECLIFTEKQIISKSRYIKDIDITKLPSSVIHINNNTGKILYKDIKIIISEYFSLPNHYWLGFNLNGDCNKWEPKYFGGHLKTKEFNLIIEFLKKKLILDK